MNNDVNIEKMILFCIEMPKDHYEQLVALFDKLSFDLTGDKEVTVKDYMIFSAFLEAMKNK